MVIVKLQGGLGNQLFQYAVGRNLALKNNCELKLDIESFKKDTLRNYELDKFGINAAIANKSDLLKYNTFSNRKLNYLCSKIKHHNYFIEKTKLFDSNVFKQNNDVYLDGYWQSEKYFIEIEDIIREEFKQIKELNDQNKKLKKKINESNSVSLHIRRGDYASNPKVNMVHGLCPIEYYNNSIDYICRKIENSTFFVFSDDLEWVKNNIKINYPVIYIDNNKSENSYLDIMLMKECKHNIIANSTFSWWGAWLNNNSKKIVIAPQKWFKIMDEKDDLIPEKWMRI